MSLKWDCNDHETWLAAEKNYWNRVKLSNKALEIELDKFTADKIEKMNAEAFYEFLRDKYFVWKYTANNRLATTKKHLSYYENNFEELLLIKNALLSFDPNNTLLGIKIALLIKGLGSAGATGLLSILFPKHFGTVDQFVVKQLREFAPYCSDSVFRSIDPENITLEQAVKIEEILISKADALNEANQIDHWTPRRIDKVLWALDR